MVYAGYAPAKLPTELTQLQSALKSVQDMSVLEVLGKLVYNSACAPTEEKFKCVKASNARIQACLSAPGFLDVLLILGWEEAFSCGNKELKCKRNMTMAQYRDIEEAKDNLKKELRKQEVSKLRAAGNA